ncbi:TANGO2 [Cordylochernes scorpioides]|uniref:TANGO2 n=1 Tax=Cordylochernes scorpioides TaxID=51811 RepID=A0ABY6KB75_9ARAC|nr:TANGO2 [Cordylochernes scorpioides]
MCMLLVYLEPDAGPEEYRLVLANIRDEIYSRPASVAHFWKDSPAIIGGKIILCRGVVRLLPPPYGITRCEPGQDLQPGREGGTWLAMNAHNGKISALLNVLQPAADLEANKKGRGRKCPNKAVVDVYTEAMMNTALEFNLTLCPGFLVVDYVKGTQSAMEYLETLSDTAHDYNGFLQFALDLSSSQMSPGNNSREMGEGSIWLQTLARNCARLTQLELLAVSRYPIDEQMMKQGCDLGDNFLQRLSAMRVNIPSSNYGSR